MQQYICPQNDDDCMWGFWSSWCACTKSCGGGIQSKRRHIVKEATNDGNCTGNEKITRQCNKNCCPRDCLWAHWGLWSRCSYQGGKSCGTGWRERSRNYAVKEYCSGKSCTGEKSMNETCSSCCPADCIWASWQNWCHCSKSCNGESKLEKDTLLKLNRVGEHVLESLVSHVHATRNAVLAIASGWNGDPGGTVSMETRISVGKEITQEYVNTNKLLFVEEGLAVDQQLK